RVALAGAKTVTVDFQGDGLLSFDATSAVADLPKDADGKTVAALVANNGVIRADGGTVLMTRAWPWPAPRPSRSTFRATAC
ncbi:hypothetical protein ACXKGW_29930, partial [Klebsiella pneumoniae subsp. pneumoniae]